MGRKIADLRKPLVCLQCIEGMSFDSDFLFDPRTSLELRKMDLATFGAYRHHTHELSFTAPAARVRHFFEVYQVTQRGLLTILETHASTDVTTAVTRALWLVHFPTPMDLKLNGL